MCLGGLRCAGARVPAVGMQQSVAECPRNLYAHLQLSGFVSRMPARHVASPTPHSGAWLLLNDLLFAIRALRRSPGYLIVGVMSLGLGLGLTTTMAAIVDAVVYPYVPYANPDQLFSITHYGDGATHAVRGYDKYVALRDGARVFDGIAAISQGQDELRVGTQVQSGGFAYVTANYFEVLDVAPSLGRAFSSRRAMAGDEHVAVVSHDLWRRAFAGRTSLEGAALTIRDRSYPVIGVMPPGVSVSGWEPSAWLVLAPARLSWPYMLAPVVRLRQGKAVSDARAELQVMAARLTAEFGTGIRPFRFEIRPARPDPLRIQDFHVALVGAGLLVLMISCANVANLMLARGLSKRSELAVRMALGASRPVVVRQMLLECLLVAIGGGILGVLLAVWGTDILANRAPSEVAFVGILKPRMSWRVLVVAALVTGMAGVGFGLYPALRTSDLNLGQLLREGAVATTNRALRSHSAIVVAEIALSLMLLMAATVLTKSAVQMGKYEFGFDGRRLWNVYVYPRPASGMTAQQRATRFGETARGLVVAARSLPAVLAVATVSEGRTTGGTVTAEPTPAGTRLVNQQSYRVVSPSFLRTLGVPVLHGRDFEEGDIDGNGAVIVDEVMASVLWPNEQAVGRMIKLGAPASVEPWLPVIGVAKSASLGFDADPDIAPERAIYVVRPQRWSLNVSLVIRVASDDPVQLEQLRLAMTVNSSGGRVVLLPLLFEFSRTITARRFMAGLFALLAAFGMALSSAGLYGVLSYAVGHRKRECGIRLALGARPQDIRRMIIGDGVMLTLAGMGIGAVLAIWTADLLGYWLYAVHPADAQSLIVSEAALFAVSMAACAIPAVSGARVSPVESLHSA